MTKLIDDRIENVKKSLNYQIIKNYGIKINVRDVKELGSHRYKVSFNYNKVFNIIDENSKTVYVRNIYFQNIYGTDVIAGEDLVLPVGEINRSITDEFIDLRQNLFQKVIADKDKMIKILKNIHTTSAFLNKFYTILNGLVYGDVITKEELKKYFESDKKYEKYVELIVDTELAEYTSNNDLKASNKFKKILENNKKEPSLAVEEAVSKILSKHYEYIIYALGIRQIKPYVNMIACMHYISEHMKLNKISISITNLYRIYENIFDAVPYIKFQEKMNSLIMSGIFSREDNTILLNC